MIDTLQIYCKNIESYVDIKGGETLLEIFRRLSDKIGIKPICAHVNNKTEGLDYPIFMPKMVEYVDVKNPSAQRMYVRSLCMVLTMLSTTCIPVQNFAFSIPFPKAISA